MAKIYLSSTYTDLAEYRKVVYRTLRQLRHDVISMEDYSARDQRPLDKCLADVASCDLYVGIFAWRYGYIPPGMDKAITELEFREAVRTEKSRLIFLLKEDTPWPPSFMDRDRQAIETLRATFQRDYLVAFFHTPDALAKEVGVAVASVWGERFSDDPDEAIAQDPSRLAFYRDCLRRITSELGSQIRFYLLSSGALFTVGMIILVVGLVMQNLILGLGGGLVSAFTLLPLTTLLSTRKKKVLLDSYEHALQQEPPAIEALTAVKRFLDHQLAT